MWSAVVSFGWKLTFFLTKVKHSPEKSLPQLHCCSDIPCDLAGWGTCKKTNVHGDSSLLWALGVTVQSNSSTCCGQSAPVPIPLPGKGYIYKSEAGQSTVTASGCRYETPDCSQKKKWNSCCQWVCSLLTQSCAQGFSISNAIASFQQLWHISKRFPSSQTENHLIKPNTISILFPQHTHLPFLCPKMKNDTQAAR